MTCEIYFGTKNHLQWIPGPSIDINATKTDWNSQQKRLDGGTYVRRSAASARQYTMTWGLKNRDDLRPLFDYADGVFGGGYIYYLDPMQSDRNVAPQYWASPFLNGEDGPLTDTTRPVITDHGDSTNGYPTRSGGITGTHSLFIPVPAGYTLHVGLHVQSGVTIGGDVKVWPVNNGTRGSSTTLTPLTTASTTRTNATFAGAADRGYEIENDGDVLYTGLIAQVRPTGESVPDGGFISGQGHSGLEFVRQPDFYEYSSGLEKVRGGAILAETEAWAWA